MPRIGALAATLLVSLFSGEAAHAQPRRAPPAEILISQGTTMCVLEHAHLEERDAATRPCLATAYLPPGTVIDRVPNRHAPNAVLFETRFGLAGRKTPYSRFWAATDFPRTGSMAFVTRVAGADGITAPDGKPCRLSIGEQYKIVPASEPVEDEVTLLLTEEKAHCVRKGESVQAIVKKDNLTIVTFDGAAINEVDESNVPIRVAHFKPHRFDNLTSFPKKCGAEITETATGIGDIGFDPGGLLTSLLEKFPITARASARLHVTRTVTSPKALKEVKEFYFSEAKMILLSQKKECKDTPAGYVELPDFWYYISADTQATDLLPEWLQNRDIRTNSETKRVMISCADEYHRFADKLRGAEFPVQTIPFLISRVAATKNFKIDCPRRNARIPG